MGMKSLANDGKICYNDRRLQGMARKFRGVAQFGSALGSGPRGRGFKSRLLDQDRAWTFVHALSWYNEQETGFEGGGDCGSNRFAVEQSADKRVCRKLDNWQLSTGARRQRRKFCCVFRQSAWISFMLAVFLWHFLGFIRFKQSTIMQILLHFCISIFLL